MDPLKAVLDTLDGVDESLHNLYEQKGDKFVLRLDTATVREHPHVTPLKNALDRTKEELEVTKNALSGAKQRLDGVPDDFDASEFSRLRAEAKAREENPDRADQQLNSQRDMYEERIRTIADKHRKDLAERDANHAALRVQIQGRDKDAALDSALATSGIKKEFLPAVRALMRPKVLIDEQTGDDKPEVYIDTDMGRQDVSQFMQNWVQTESGKIYVEPATGGDAGGSGTRLPPNTENPWRTDGGRKPNLTKQSQIISQNPALARRLASQAGVNLPAGI